MVVIGIWQGRHATALQRASRLTNEGFAAELGVAVRTVAKWNAHPELEQTPEMRQILDTQLAKSADVVKARFAQILNISEGGHPLTANSDGKPQGIEDVTTLVAEINATTTSSESIAQLEQATRALAESHTQAPARKVLTQVFQLHQEARHLIGRTQRLSQRRTLYRIESDLLAHACLLLGDLKHDEAAEQYGRAARAFAQEAESNEALALTALAKTLRWQERLIESA